jgi:hypothetical protein
VGRKGSGKTALFFQIRDKVRTDRQNVVLDLKPEGHQLKRFRDVLLLLSDSVQEHLATAFWEYVLLLEICHKLLQNDKNYYKRDHIIYKSYERISSLYSNSDVIEEADFSERILGIVNRIRSECEEMIGAKKQEYISVALVNQMLYRHDIPTLREELVAYLKLKKSVWILFDNIDKGWPTRGVGKTDIIILRALIDSTRKIERFFQKHAIDVKTIIFIRNDVFEILLDDSPDRGKEAKVSVDWTDPERLKELLRLRLIYNGFDKSSSFNTIWNSICISHIQGEETSEYLIRRSLMRPRNFLSLVNHCKSNAVNFRHSKILERDITKACEMYSADLVNEIGYEIRDVFSQADEILYYFLGQNAVISLNELEECIKDSEVADNDYNKLTEILLWFGFLGVRRVANDEIVDTYIYDVFYDMNKLKRLADNFKNKNTKFCIHCAFWPFLEINEEFCKI